MACRPACGGRGRGDHPDRDGLDGLARLGRLGPSGRRAGAVDPRREPTIPGPGALLHRGGGRPRPAPPPAQGEVVRAAWARERGGVDANSTGFQVVIQGTSTSSVVLKGLTIRVLVEAASPARGRWSSRSGQGARRRGTSTVDLDAPAPRATFDFGETSGREERPIDFPYQVSESEPEVFFIFASAHRSIAHRVAELAWSAKGNERGRHNRRRRRAVPTVSGEAATAYRASDERAPRAGAGDLTRGAPLPLAQA